MTSWWRARADRERRVIAVAGALLAVAILVLLWIQAERTRSRLQRELPMLRASIAGLQRDADEVRRLRDMPSASAPAATPLASLATNAGGVPGANITVLDERRVRFSGADVAFATLLEWLRASQATHGMRVESARIEALPAAGRVRADLVLARS